MFTSVLVAPDVSGHSFEKLYFLLNNLFWKSTFPFTWGIVLTWSTVTFTKVKHKSTCYNTAYNITRLVDYWNGNLTYEYWLDHLGGIFHISRGRLMVRSSVVVYTVYTSSDSEITFTSRELVTKKAAPVSDLHLVSIIACTRSRR